MKFVASIIIVLFLLVCFFFFYIRISDFLSCRQVLNIMVILGFMLNYALRVNLTIAIVAMVEEPKGTTPTIPMPQKTIEHNDTFALNSHNSIDGLRSAAHTLSIEPTLQPFQNSTDNNVSITHFFFCLFYFLLKFIYSFSMIQFTYSIVRIVFITFYFISFRNHFK